MKPQYIEIDEYGSKLYYADKAMKKLHRTDGPAVEHSNGFKAWYLNGELNREDGPAIEWEDSHKAWYLNGKEITAAKVVDQMQADRDAYRKERDECAKLLAEIIDTQPVALVGSDWSKVKRVIRRSFPDYDPYVQPWPACLTGNKEDER